MTVSTEISREHYVGNGKTTVFDYRFRIFSDEDLRVEIADAQHQLTPLIVNTDFTVSGADSQQGGKIQLKKPLAENWHITIERQLPVTQETDLRNQGHFFPEVHEDVFDKLTMLIQQVFGKFGLELRKPSWLANYFDARQQRIIKLAGPVDAEDAATKGYADTLNAKTNDRVGKLHADISGRALRAPEANISPIPDAATRAGKLLSFDASGAPIAALPPTGSAAGVLAELAKSNGATKIGSQQPDGKSETVQQALSALRDAVGKKLDIGGAVNTLVSRGRVPALSGNNQGTSGIQLYEAYGNGYPTPYGNVIHLKGANGGGEGELLVGWSGVDGAHAPLYVRNRRDVTGAEWSAWAQVFTANELAGIPLPFPGEFPPSGWLKCNGQAFNKATYPVLASLYPSGKLPDLRGEFIRGWDDRRKVDLGRALLSEQEDAMQPITAKWAMDDMAAGGDINYPPVGALYIDRTANVNYDAMTSRHGIGARGVFDSSLQTRTANETRPRNIAFNYIVRAA